MNVDKLWDKYYNIHTGNGTTQAMDKEHFTKAIAEVISLPVDAVVIKKSKDLGDELCDYCPLEKKGVYSVPGGYKAGCEGSHCEEAYENYKDEVSL